MIPAGRSPEFASLLRWLAQVRRDEDRARWPAALRWMAGPWRRLHRQLDALRKAWPTWRQSCDEVARREGAGRLAQLWHLWRLMARYPLTAKEFYLLRFFDRGRRKAAPRYVYRLWNINVLRRLEPGHGSYWHKLEFMQACRGIGLPLIPVLGTWRDGQLRIAEAAPAWEGDLYVKPEQGARGRAVERWPAAPMAVVLERCRGLPDGETFLIQPHIRNHPDLAPVSNGNISSLRITTCRTPAGDIESLLPVLQISAGSTVTDHMLHGNLAAPVDPASATLGHACSYDGRFVVSRHEWHPDTGERIPGRVVPHFHEAVELCRRGHAAFDRLIAMAWDVAVTADGPVVIEGNRIFNIQLPQMVWDQPLGPTVYPAALWARARAREQARGQG